MLVLLSLFVLAVEGVTVQAQSLNAGVLECTFKGDKAKKISVRKLMKFRRKAMYFNPLSYVGAGLMFAYQNSISEQMQTNCMYEISCSEYTKRSIQESGIVAGVLKGFYQLSECHPAALYEHPRSFINGGKIINRIEGAKK